MYGICTPASTDGFEGAIWQRWKSHGRRISREARMPAFYINNNGAMVYYFPPPPPPPPPPAPPPTGTNAPGFKSAVAGAHQATNSYECGHGSKTTVEDDWGSVENIIEEQYRLALNSSDPHAAVAALNQQYGSYFQHEGCSTSIYNEVVTDGRK